MSIKDIRSKLGTYAKDIKINLGNVLTEEGSEGLSLNQIYGVALSCAYATGHHHFVEAMEEDAAEVLSEAEIEAAKAAATIMGMNNIYYRFVHLVSDEDYGKMPAGLRMNIIGNPGVDRVDFELYSLAVSAINGCGMCMDAHVAQVVNHVGKKGVQSSIKIASVVNATAQALRIS